MSLKFYILTIILALPCIVLIYKRTDNTFTSAVKIIVVALVFHITSILTGANLMQKNAEVVKTELKMEVSFLPNQVADKDTSTFIVDNKELKAFKTKDTLYIEDSKEKPYIIAVKTTYNCKSLWYISNEVLEEINNTVHYTLKEMHY